MDPAPAAPETRFPSRTIRHTLRAMQGSCPTEFLALAGRLADASGAVIRRHFRTPVPVEDKDDDSPVTIADRDAETAMRAIIREAFPDHGIVGEEHDDVNPGAAHVWVLDPIDGTKAFIAGKPTFGTLIGLARDGVPILGVIDQPVYGERWLGAAGHPTTFNGDPVRARACATLDHAILNTTGPDLFPGNTGEAFDRLAGRVKRTLYGGDCYAYGLVASGFIDLVAEAGLKSHDFCALAPVVTGAGGAMTDWSGDTLTIGSDGTVLACGDPALLDAAIDSLRSA